MSTADERCITAFSYAVCTECSSEQEHEANRARDYPAFTAPIARPDLAKELSVVEYNVGRAYFNAHKIKVVRHTPTRDMHDIAGWERLDTGVRQRWTDAAIEFLAYMRGMEVTPTEAD